METWAAWQETKALAFLHARVRQLLVAQGIEDCFVEVPARVAGGRGDAGTRPVHVYMGGPKNAARTVVLLHGLGDSANNWFRTLPLLAWRGDRVIAIDLPGHGHSPAHDERGFLTIGEHAEVVRDVVEGHAVGTQLALVGHSLGGWVATRAHIGSPQAADKSRPAGRDGVGSPQAADKSRPAGRDGVGSPQAADKSRPAGRDGGLPVDRLVLVESAGLEHEGMWEGIELLRIEHEEDVKKFFKTICHHTPFALHLLSKEVAAMFRSPAVVNFINAYEEGDVIRDEELARVTAKTTILWGEDDGLIPPILAHRWHAGIPGSTLRWMARCGHTPQFERPVLFHRLLEEALGHPPVHETIRDRVVARMPGVVRRRLAKG